MKKNAKILTLLAVLLPALTVAAQWRQEVVSDSSKWDFHLSTGIAIGSGWGRTDAATWVAPSLEYHASERLTLHGGFAMVNSPFGQHELRGLERRSLTPRREGTRLLAATMGAEYQVNDRLRLWGSLTRINGFAQPLWHHHAMPVDVTAFSGGLSYATSNDCLMQLHFHFVHDHYGNAALGLLGHPWYGPFCPSYELFAGPWPF